MVGARAHLALVRAAEDVGRRRHQYFLSIGT